MKDIRLLRANGRQARPWRNGGGTTCDIAVYPEGAGDDGFLWRASIATIASAGPFSTFAGVDRLLLPIEGTLDLTIDGLGDRRLRPGDPALAFAGETAVTAAPRDRPVRVLNIMVRRGAMRAELDRCMQAVPGTANAILLLATERTTVRQAAKAFDLELYDALLIDDGQLGAIDIEPCAVAGSFFDIC
ncbi:HutD family protein [Sphingopyxis macrogoltabida]|uniref:HutD/Ves family protein n=1 Tax=Sphingopyxis macrogoltabida TaxID=33050 RepID=UPI0006CAA0CB|nr:HutD family protein [Sphingopyxis macrogoltabida]